MAPMHGASTAERPDERHRTASAAGGQSTRLRSCRQLPGSTGRTNWTRPTWTIHGASKEVEESIHDYMSAARGHRGVVKQQLPCRWNPLAPLALVSPRSIPHERLRTVLQRQSGWLFQKREGHRLTSLLRASTRSSRTEQHRQPAGSQQSWADRSIVPRSNGRTGRFGGIHKGECVGPGRGVTIAESEDGLFRVLQDLLAGDELAVDVDFAKLQRRML
jgi:hypothetical protein